MCVCSGANLALFILLHTRIHAQTELRTLDISANQISVLTGVAHLTHLEEFWANNNQLSSLPEVEAQLKHLEELETVYLEHNPLQQSAGPRYRAKIADLLPQVKQIDASSVLSFIVSKEGGRKQDAHFIPLAQLRPTVVGL